MPERPRISALRTFAVAATLAALGLLALLLLQRLADTPIGAAQRAAELTALSAVLPGDLYDNDPIQDRIVLHDRETFGEDATIVLRARLHGQPSALVLRATAAKGYSGPIALLIGVRADGTVLGVRVTAHRETPGLGDAIDETGDGAWIQGFTGKSLAKPPAQAWDTRRDGGDFDQISGATATSHAIVLQMRKVLEYVSTHREPLFAPAP